jgi:hypothetical protein
MRSSWGRKRRTQSRWPWSVAGWKNVRMILSKSFRSDGSSDWFWPRRCCTNRKCCCWMSLRLGSIRSRIDLRQQLKSLNADGLTVLISSHILADLEDICTHVAFIENGANAAGADGQSAVELHPKADDQQEYEIAWLGAADIQGFASRNPQVKLISTEGSTAQVRIGAGASSAAVTLKALISSGIQITRFAESNDGLENRYQKVFGGRP